MPEVTIVYWRDIPAQVMVRAGRRTVRRALPARFQEAIDRAAMRAGLAGSDAYLAAWRRGPAEPCGDDLEAEADRLVEELLRAFDEDRLRELAARGGRAS